MWNEKAIEEYLKKNLKATRYEHSLGVRDCAVLLAKKYKVDQKKARLAGLIHDCAKDLKDEEIINLVRESNLEICEVCFKSPQIMHGLAGAIVAKNVFKVVDEEILNAITYHTTGRKGMTALEKIIFLADFIEPGRDFLGVEDLRALAYKDLERALFLAFDNTINFVITKGGLLHLDTVTARNDIIIKNNFLGGNIMSKEIISTKNAPAAIGPYSQAIKVGNLLFSSGQIPLDPSTGELVNSDIKAATRRVLENLRGILEASGASFENVIKTVVYLKDMKDFVAVNEIYSQYFTSKQPARSCVQVAKLPKDAMVEIEVIALIE